MSDAVLVATDLERSFPIQRGFSKAQVRAVDGVSLTIHQGETVAVIGESGCGKSTLGRLVAHLDEPDAGRVMLAGTDPSGIRGRALREWRRRVQVVFQDPYASLDERMTAGRIVAEPWLAHPEKRPADPRARVAELLELVGMRASDADKSPQQFSGGQRQRIGIARALALDPELIVADEPVSALDLSVQAHIINLMQRLQTDLGLSYLFISHDLAVVRHIADRVAVMYLGRIVESGPADEIFERPTHPYTRALLSAAPQLDRADPRQRIVLQGEIPSPTQPPTGCGFRTRCWLATEACAEVPGLLARDNPRHAVACHHPFREPTAQPADENRAS
ncbi:ABC transporter ATP-binding protein [uncultured Demequina sp.]|uniref:ABC transporter ATP-binding protein n=1 Tax=uncultured Demequina sp. TaxID=693499 RepID=UPI0025F7C924|nr:oligopeptide/dipeptide ABC transporter ATP-binding protein [uncultured Demequina sp.]